MLLSSKNDESDEIKTFEVYSSYITLASTCKIFKQAKTFICVMVYIVKKCDVLKRGYLFSGFVRARSTRHF